LALGEKLVKEFGGSDNADTLSQWMAHDLAAKLKEWKAAKGPKKVELEGECRTTILQIWKHRASFPYDRRPFKSFDAVFRALESLDPTREGGRFFDFNFVTQSKRDDPSKKVKEWLDAAIVLDRGARTLVALCIEIATRAAGKEEHEWLKAARAVREEEDGQDLRAIFVLAENAAGADAKPNANEIERTRLERLRDISKQLKGYLLV
jgi:hypothetical protein